MGDDNLVTRAVCVVQVGVVVGTIVKLLLTSLSVQTMNNNNSCLLITSVVIFQTSSDFNNVVGNTGTTT